MWFAQFSALIRANAFGKGISAASSSWVSFLTPQRMVRPLPMTTLILLIVNVLPNFKMKGWLVNRMLSNSAPPLTRI